MNKKILQKVIDALKEDKKEYAMGILDTLIDSLPELPNERIVPIVKDMSPITSSSATPTVTIDDESKALDNYARVMKTKLNLGNIQTE